ncbi:MAG: rhodanese-like domain-containing protein, partial [Solirubrobacteraceae bacterium]|nr:rhodanese-like domain-containing protein [Solirubrobacteraceae bacterium]
MPALIDPAELQGSSGDQGAGALLEIGYEGSPAGTPAVLPRARRVDWRELLWDARERRIARPEQLACRLGSLGIEPGAPLVVYGDPVQFGAYAAWALEVAGYPDVSLLDGGKEAWVGGSLPLVPAPSETLFSPGGATPTWTAPTASPERIDRHAVERALEDPSWALLDVRSREEYLGDRVSPPEFDVDHGAAVGGRLPGARHLPFRELLRPDGRFLPAASIARRLEAAGVDPAQRIVTYCRLGHRAALAWFALRVVLGAP